MDFLAVEIQLGLVSVLISLTLAAVSFLLSVLLRPAPEDPAADTSPQGGVKMGGFIPFQLGRRRIPAIIQWVGNHYTRRIKVSGDKDAPKSTHNYESAIHALSVGKGHALHAIYANGSLIWNGPLTRETFPSGSLASYGEFAFKIFWGEDDQEPDADVADAIGINSGFPGIFYIHWISYHLGLQRVWPVLTYETEVRVEDELLGSDSYIDATQVASGLAVAITGVNNGVPGAAYVEVLGKWTDTFFTGESLVIQGGNPADGTYLIYSASIFTVTTSVDGKPVYTRYTRIFLNATLAGATVSGSLDSITYEPDDGMNTAHIINQLLFSAWPFGLELDQDLFNITSLQEVGVLMETEGITGSVIGNEGATAQGLLSNSLIDAGVMLSWDVREENFKFISQREPAGSLDSIPESLVRRPLPEIGSHIGRHPASRFVFTFADRKMQFTTNTVTIDNDAQAGQSGHVETRSVSMPTVIDYGTAGIVANRRSQEELGQLSVWKVTLGRECRVFKCGTPMVIFGVPGTVRLLQVEFQDSSNDVVFSVAADFYGVAIAVKEFNLNGSVQPENNNSLDEASAIVEIPEHLNKNNGTKVIIPRIRDNAAIPGARIWISSDDVTYDDIGEANAVVSGGFLDEAIGIDDDWFITQGPEFSIAGPDIGEVEDLSSDAANWRRGRQICIIGDEIFFLKLVTSIDSDTYRLDGLIRARYDTVRQAHSIGAPVFIFRIRGITNFGDTLIFPEDTVYFKAQPIFTGSIALDDLETHTHVVHGKGVVPMDPENLRTENMTNIFATGEDVPLKWSYRSALWLRTGAGMQGAGNPTAQSPIDGEFILRFLTTGDVLKKEISALEAASYTADNADLVTWFGAEPSAFKVAVTAVKAGFESDSRTITVTRV